jgi:phytoene dehydrogenase-like protein
MSGVLTIVGGGIGGMTAAIAAAERGAAVTLHEAKDRLGGKAWTTDGAFRANRGPHVIYGDSDWWAWLRSHGVGKPAHRIPAVSRLAFHINGTSRRVPPARTLVALAKLRRRAAPTERSFAAWATKLVGDAEARSIANFMGVVTFDHDPGRLSAQLIQERRVRQRTRSDSPLHARRMADPHRSPCAACPHRSRPAGRISCKRPSLSSA